ncbi:TonB-dependent receptor [Termitidicoccus mucosus]|uniref:Uncharacterized protein n=1 Tax=Termitidicoccus mucosus TaxID=1184151 RepID=A0A178INR1_9BACT|nr:hypothetical protein AW736_06645 [Opitutaceae bacterium TSB47]
MRANLGYTSRDFWQLWPGSLALWDPYNNRWSNTAGTAQAYRTSMNYQTIDYDQYGGQLDFTKTWKSRVRQRSLLTFDWFRNKQHNWQWGLSGTNLMNAVMSLGLDSAEWQGWRAADPFNTEPKYSLLPSFDPGAGWTGTDASTYSTDLTFYGALFNHTVEMLDGRLNLTGSIRQDFSSIKNRRPLSANGNLSSAKSNEDNFSYSVGLTYNIIPKKFIAYASYGTSFNPEPTVDPNVGTIYGNTTAEGGEVGFKGLLMQERFSYTISFYQVTQDNETTRNPESLIYPDDTTIPYYIDGGSTRGKGIGIDLSGRLLPGLTMIGNASWVAAEVVKNMEDPSLVGTRPLNIPSRTFGVGMTYRPQRILKGTRIGVSYKYIAEALRIRAVGRSSGSLARTDYQIPSSSDWSMFAGYEVRLRNGMQVDFSVNILNLFDKRTISQASFGPNGREARFTVKVAF